MMARHKSVEKARHGTHIVSRDTHRGNCAVCGYQRRVLTLKPRRWPNTLTRKVNLCITCLNRLLQFLMSFYSHTESEWLDNRGKGASE